MAENSSSGVVIAALGCNVLIAFAKFGAAAFTGSSAMLSEAVHSLADASNQVLLLHGLSRARRPPDERFPFGYGRELYFWSFIVAILLFSMGAGVSIYEGVAKLTNPHPLHEPQVAYAVLGIALLLEGGSGYVALRSFNRARGRQPFVQALRSSKDPAVFTVLLEDAAAIVGILMALAGVLLAHLGGIEAADGIASLAIGVLLGAVAAFLAVEIKSLLIGEAAAKPLQVGVAKLVGKHDGPSGPIQHVNDIKTMQLGPNDVLVAVSVDLNDEATAGEVEHLTSRLESAVRQRFPEVSHFYLEVQAAARHKAFAADRGAQARPDPAMPPPPTSEAPLVVEALRAVEKAADAEQAAEPAKAAVPVRPPVKVAQHPHGTRKRGKRGRR